MIIFITKLVIFIFLDGKTGVYDIEDLVDLLRKENAIDICVIKLPKEYSYVDFMCIVTGSSFRHMSGIAAFVRKVYKMKRHPTDSIPKIEGKDCKQWMAMDLGNIALHIFSKQSREIYSLETLWTLGDEYEKRTKKPELAEEMYAQYLNISNPADGKDDTTLDDNVQQQNIKEKSKSVF